MEKLICKECGKVFEYEKMSSCRAQLRVHIEKEHNMKLEDYIVKHEYGGKHPMCPCGCGHKLTLKEGWTFHQYYSDTCYGRMVKAGNEEILKQYNETHKKDFDIVKYYESHYDRKTFESAFDLLKTKEFSLSDVAKSYNIDKRTLKKVWLAMKITTVAELNELLEYTKYVLSAKNYSSSDIAQDDNILPWMFQLIKTFPGKYGINTLIKAYNEAHKDNPVSIHNTKVETELYKKYGDEVDIYLSCGLHSSEEYQFYQILKFYLTEYKIKLGKKFVTEKGNRYYDIMIGSNILIEYDSDGYFYQDDTKERDKEKENFAKENGYIFLRFSKKDIHNIDTLLKIKKLLKENETN